MIYELALRSKDSLDFLQMLKIGGFRRIGGTASAAAAQGSSADKDSASLQLEPADGRMIKIPRPRAHHHISRAKDLFPAEVAAAHGRDPKPGGQAETSLTEVAADGGPPPLSRCLAHKYAINGTIVITLANYALWDFVKSWAHHVKGVGKFI